MNENWKNIITFVIILAITLSAGFIGSIFTTDNIPTWYASIKKPSFNPPNGVFAPVWTILYIFMAIATYMVWSKRHERNITIPITLFIIQLILNTIWSIIFFGMHNIWLGLVDIILLWFFILFTIISYYRVSQYSIVYLIPYILWVSFAAVLNYSILMLN